MISDVQGFVCKIARHPTFICNFFTSLLCSYCESERKFAKVTYSKIHCIVLHIPNLKWILGFPIPSIILVKAGLTQIMHHA